MMRNVVEGREPFLMPHIQVERSRSETPVGLGIIGRPVRDIWPVTRCINASQPVF